LFADDDLRAIADVLPVDSYPRGLPAVARRAPPCPWMYTGALENAPQIIAEISSARTLWGNPPASLAVVRDPLAVVDALASAGLPIAAVRSSRDRPPCDGTWMLKPIRGGGGRGIRVWDEAATRSRILNEPHYFQQRIEGTANAAVFVATGKRAHLVGVTRQLVGEPEFGAAGSAYCGSIGPLWLGGPAASEIEQAGNCLARRANLRGLFGVDFVGNGQHAFTIEVNPRYTASVEIFERASETALLELHRRACREDPSAPESAEADEFIEGQLRSLRTASSPRIVGKAILFALETMTIPSLEGFTASRARSGWLTAADRPIPGSVVAAGRPLCTILVEGGDPDECRARLVEGAAALREWLASLRR
jgi:predicted ATP-grasp superfamily ATP-dependent carboligase